MITLQNIIAPEPLISNETELYYRTTEAAQVCQDRFHFALTEGERVEFDTYFNLFNLGTWSKTCTIEGLSLEVIATGSAEIRIHHQHQDAPRTLLYHSSQILTRAAPHRVDLAALLAETKEGILSLELVSLERDLQIFGARFGCTNLPASLPRLAVSITTFKREENVRSTVARLTSFLADFAYGDQIHIQVVDNGNSAEIDNSACVSSYNNHNFGGAGGFARGLLEAEDHGFSHCLFMDDDASFHMENIQRAYMLLALARDPKTALAGAMISNGRKWALWENGAYFNGSCHPLFNGTDLRQPKAVHEMEFSKDQAQPTGFYGGWWFFAFPVDQVRHHPFPFFVRGDDISFSLANDFNIVTLNGVVSFQDDFVEKESAQTLYLDLRNHLLHHLVFDQLERSALGTARIACRFMMRSMLRCKYESAAAQLLAWQDVMQGPAFFDRNIDMQTRRASIHALIQDEAWQDLQPRQRPGQQPERRYFSRLPRRFRHYLGLISLNGHLLPFWSRIGDRMSLEIKDRGLVFPAFGGARLTYLDSSRSRGYTVHHSKRRFFTLAWQMATTLLRWQRQHDRLKQEYRRGYNKMTTRAYWESRLNRQEPGTEPRQPQPSASQAL